MKLNKEEVVTIEVLRLKGETNQAIVARLGITEGRFATVCGAKFSKRLMAARSSR